MDQVLSELYEMFVYLDIIIYASSLAEQQTTFNKFAERLRQANLKLQPDKCELLQKEVSYFGHVIGKDTVKSDSLKILAVKEFLRSRTSKNIKQFLGLARYYRFILNFPKITKPLRKLLKKDEKFISNEAQDKAFKKLRYLLCSESLLQYLDFTKPFVVTTNAPGYAIGDILSQGTIGKDLPVAYTSRLLNKTEQNYSIEKELLAIVFSRQRIIFPTIYLR